MLRKQPLYSLELYGEGSEECTQIASFEEKPSLESIHKVLEQQVTHEFSDDELEWFISPVNPGECCMTSQDGWSLIFTCLSSPLETLKESTNAS